MQKKVKLYGLIISIFSLVILSIVCFKSDNVKATTKKSFSKGSTVFVDIKGAVKSPGVYEVSSNSRIIDVIVKAGDLKKDADTSTLNLSKKVKDEMYIIIYTKDEINDYKNNLSSSSEVNKEIEKNVVCIDSDNDACINKNNKSSFKVNINTSSLDELSSLTGIGETKAKKIIEYRTKTKFEKIEDIMNVDGIGNSLYEKIKNNIEV